MAITSGWASAIIALVALFGAAAAGWLRFIDSGQEKRIDGIRETLKILFTKHDEVLKELQDYKLHVAEKYVGKETLEKALEPIYAMLKELRDELRESRK